MSFVVWLAVAGLLAGWAWLARARRARRGRIRHVHQVLLRTDDSTERFDPATLTRLPDPARAYLRHAIAPDAPLPRTVDVRMSGSLRVTEAGDWVPFEARERICAERGFVWEARIAALRRLTMEGADWLMGEDAGTEFALGGWFPAIHQTGEDVARSAAGRLVVELIWLPSALTPQRGATWASGDEYRAVVTPSGSNTPMTVLVDRAGVLRQVSLVRRRVAPDGRISVAPFGAVIEAEERFNGFTVPTRVIGAWGIGTDDHYEFFRADVTDIDWH